MAETPIKRDGRKENASATQTALQRVALRWFSEQGYEKAPVGSICADAGVTVGALYHHYGDKKGLFAAVVEQVDAQLVQAAVAASQGIVDSGGGVWDAFLASVDTVLQAGANAPLRRLMLVEAPAVLGAQVWGEIRQRQGLGAMRAQIDALQAHGIFRGHDAERLARIILGALYGAMDSMPADDNKGLTALDDAKRCLVAMLEGLLRG
ncbi:TetR/AcrR family transcriptional regulator [Rhodoferax saidenbachensis]|uniref:AcrR family transcriptional regulator n=1 Tax=Rhodoferax saidenbachensis TaxID=1484693 RepID=A0ABU1ZLE2_9BURK|nr:TetR/AcrR family transcriptional regulator [Rhodoferax saidenbachensis]MDR7306366.1 AcrR family transcriptional regulator [Rhodoferax saidenbachensis]